MLKSLDFLRFLIGIFACITVVSAQDSISTDPDDIRFYLFPNPADVSDYDELQYSSIASITKSRFSADKKVILLIHGFKNNFESVMPQAIVNAYLRAGFARDSNIIAVDWGKLAGEDLKHALPLAILLETLPFYRTARSNVLIVGKRIEEFLVFLQRNRKISGPGVVHLIGHSLGAHIAGMAGMYFTESTSRSLNRITGLDPAGPGYRSVSEDERLDPTDAEFVDIVHTNQGEFGIKGELGHVDFLMNGGGRFQPGCGQTVVTDNGCSHRRSVYYYARSILDRSIRGFRREGSNLPSITFGEYCPRNARGEYLVEIVTDD